MAAMLGRLAEWLQKNACAIGPRYANYRMARVKRPSQAGYTNATALTTGSKSYSSPLAGRVHIHLLGACVNFSIVFVDKPYKL